MYINWRLYCYGKKEWRWNYRATCYDPYIFLLRCPHSNSEYLTSRVIKQESIKIFITEPQSYPLKAPLITFSYSLSNSETFLIKKIGRYCRRHWFDVPLFQFFSPTGRLTSVLFESIRRWVCSKTNGLRLNGRFLSWMPFFVPKWSVLFVFVYAFLFGWLCWKMFVLECVKWFEWCFLFRSYFLRDKFNGRYCFDERVSMNNIPIFMRVQKH